MRRSATPAALVILTLVAATPAVAQGTSSTTPPPASSAGAAAYSCGVPATPAPATPSAPPVFAPGQYPVSLPATSLLGAPNNLPNPYREGADFGQLPAGRKWGSTASVTTAPDGTIWVADRCGNSGNGGSTCGGASASVDPIFQLDTSGKVLKQFGAGMFVSPHKLTVDREGNLWLADNGAHQVFKMDPSGKVLLTLGQKGKPGTGPDQFDAPTEVAVAADGTIYVADGHNGGGTATGNARIVVFDKTGRFLRTWGRKGMGPGELDVPHTLALDSRGRVFVGDRQNNRIQVFEPDGRHVATWYQFSRPSGIYIDTRTDTIYVADSESRDGRTNIGQLTLAQTGYGYNLGARRGIRIGSARTGRVQSFIPDPCPYPYPSGSSFAEGVTVDRDGNVYGADFLMNVRKFIRK